MADQPDILAELLATLASLQSHAGQRTEAMSLLAESTDLYRTLATGHTANVAINEAEYANLLSVDDYAAAQTHLQSALDSLSDSTSVQPQVASSVWLDAGHIERAAGNADQALEYYRQAAEALNQSTEQNSSQRIEVLFSQADALLRLDDLQTAEPLLREALALGEAQFGPDHSRLTGTLSALGQLERQRGA